MEMDHSDMRNQLLAELIDKMHERMASKMFPDISHGDNEAASAEGKPPVMNMGGEVCSTEAPMPQDEDDEELMNELMNQES